MDTAAWPTLRPYKGSLILYSFFFTLYPLAFPLWAPFAKPASRRIGKNCWLQLGLQRERERESSSETIIRLSSGNDRRRRAYKRFASTLGVVVWRTKTTRWFVGTPDVSCTKLWAHILAHRNFGLLWACFKQVNWLASFGPKKMSSSKQRVNETLRSVDGIRAARSGTSERRFNESERERHLAISRFASSIWLGLFALAFGESSQSCSICAQVCCSGSCFRARRAWRACLKSAQT